jgi:hypothetical protein
MMRGIPTFCTINGNNMKLAEALAERSDCQTRIEQLKQRLARSARVQEGETPPESPAELLVELDRLFARLIELVQAINRTNSRTAFTESLTIADAIAERDSTGKKRDALAAFIEVASTRQDRYSKSEVKFIATVSVGEIQRQADALAKRYRAMDTKIQELNWTTELA